MSRKWQVLFFLLSYVYTYLAFAGSFADTLLVVNDIDDQEQHGFFRWPEEENSEVPVGSSGQQLERHSEDTNGLSQEDRDAPQFSDDPVTEPALSVERADSEEVSAIPTQANDAAKVTSLEAGLWMIEETASILSQDKPVHREIKTTDVCYSAGFIERETKDGFMLNIGQDFLSGFSCKVNSRGSEGDLLFQHATCQTEKGEELALLYTLKLAGQQFSGVLEMSSGTTMFRLDIVGHKIGDCSTESLYDY